MSFEESYLLYETVNKIIFIYTCLFDDNNLDIFTYDRCNVVTVATEIALDY